MTKKSTPRIFGSGLIALDLVISADPDIPTHDWAGGTCGNVLAILAFLGWESFPIARLNGDPASLRVKADLKKWRVRLDYAECTPTSHTPIIVQQIIRDQHGPPKHKFIWSCPSCGTRLPSFKPITKDVVDLVEPALSGTSVFFFDRLSRGVITLAKAAADRGILVMFEPSGKGNPTLFKEAVAVAHIIKYSRERLSEADGAMSKTSNTLVEIQTLGEEGLRLRDKLAGRATGWHHEKPAHAPVIVDTCGSGDWCTAGMLSRLGAKGQVGLKKGGRSLLSEAISYGQTLAAWNCGFEGARGGMYVAKTKSGLDKQIGVMKAGKISRATMTSYIRKTSDKFACPACPV